MSRHRVLVIAEAANPEWTSVPLVGFSHAAALRRAADVHLVTQVRNREALRRAGFREGVDFTALDTEHVARPFHLTSEWMRRHLGFGFTLTTATETFAYFEFERILWRRFGDRIRRREFDVVHRVTPLSPTTPSLLAAHCAAASVPFVLGPLNGGVPWPPQFRDRQRREGDWLAVVRDAYKLLPGYASTLRNASAIVAGSLYVESQIPERYRDKVVYVPENAVDPSRFTRTVQRPVVAPLRVAFLGRLVAYKGADMLLEAAASLVREGRVVIDVIGDGPERPHLEELARRLGIEESVRFAGFVPHIEMSARLVESDVLALPSIREFGGGVVLEAMMLGLVPIVVDYAGPTELVTSETGLRVPLGDREAIVRGFEEALRRASTMGEELREMGRRGHARVVEKLTWDAKAQQMLKVYDFALGRAARPDFGLLESR